MGFRLLFLSLSFLTGKLGLQGQQTLPTIHAGSKHVTILFNDSKTEWYLQPELKPDVFTVGSTLKKKQVRFLTDKDSLTISIEAGHHYDFIILLNGKEACYTRVAAMNDPLFLHLKAGIAVLVFYLAFLFFVYKKRTSLSTQRLLRFGIITSLCFWVITIIGGFLHRDYHHLKMTVSELGTMGKGSEIFMSVTTVLLSVFSLLFSVGFYKGCKKQGLNTLPAVLSFAMPVSFAWAAVFPSGHELHGSLGPLPLCIMIASLICFVSWEKGKNYTTLRILCLAGFLVMTFFALRFIPSLQQQYGGLTQRFFYLGWTVWCLSIGSQLPALIRRK